ncbi:MAG: aspartate/glutamate racemase family protein [Dehalococcoidia bacterium]|nr:aspartate/glutamate racemase family protein [Dehalococcoidia bacterium]
MKRIGALFPSSGVSEYEIQKVLPEGVSLHVTRIPMNMPTYEAELRMADTVEQSAALLADAMVDIVAFACTAGSFVKGKGHDREIMNRITHATGLPATTTTTAVVAGLKALGIEKLVMLSPYKQEMNELEKTFLGGEGFEVLNYRGLGLADCIQQYDMEPRHWYELIREMQDSQADGYFISCGGIRVVDIINRAEIDLGKPVITSNQALVWHCLRKMGMEKDVAGFGSLMKTPLKT